MPDTLAFLYYSSGRAKKHDKRSSACPFLQWTAPGALGVPLALFREPDGILIVSPDLLPPDTLAALPPRSESQEQVEDGEMKGEAHAVHHS